MALDTQSKRLSAIFAGSPWRAHLPMPDASLDQGDRQHLALWCSAVLFEATIGGEESVLVVGLGCSASSLILDVSAVSFQLEVTLGRNALECEIGERQ